MWMTTTTNGTSSYQRWDSPLTLPSRKPLELLQQNCSLEGNWEGQWIKFCTVQISLLTPTSYDVISHIQQLQSQVKESCRKAQHRQLRNYNKKRRDSTFKIKDRVWLRNLPQSSAQNKFSAKLAPKWKGPYRVLKSLGPLNYHIALEATGEDVRTAHVCNLKMCFPTAEQLEDQAKKVIQDIFQETSDEEEFLGFWFFS